MGCGKRGEVLGCDGTGEGGDDDAAAAVELRTVQTEGRR